ncbi:RloB family protein [Actinomadura litoris]|uniref:RloB family protein n=1 Tax=Actinomadura litoris TaxID=2678616 RepID=UPI001FA7AFF5|nr:RloB family protein [Actinomadura litoris]
MTRRAKPSGRPARGAPLRTETDLRRKPSGSRPERRSYLIVCEGETEKLYFIGMRRHGGPQLTVKAPGDDHLALVRKAAASFHEVEYDEVWCVLDTELDDKLVAQLVAEADRMSVNLALSCPSFELWLILHLTDHRRFFQSAREAEKLLKELRPGWTKTATRFKDFEEGVEDACARARNLHSDECPRNPSSGVWRLVEKLRVPPSQ